LQEGVDGREERRADVGFGDEGPGTGGLDDAKHFGAFVHRDNEDGHGRTILVNFYGRGDAVHDGHGDVEEDDIRVEF